MTESNSAAMTAARTAAATSHRLAAAEERLHAQGDALRADIARELRKLDADRYGVLADNVADRAELSAADLLVDVDLAEIDRDVTELREVEAALGRVAAGTYGTCGDCGNGIEAERLAHAPHARRCLSCQQLSEGWGAKRRHLTL